MNYWANEELNLLKLHYQNPSSNFLMSCLPNRTWSAIRAQASLLGLKIKKRSVRHWTEKENQLLHDVYCNKSRTEIEKLFPNRTWLAIKVQSNKLGLRITKSQQSEQHRQCNLSPLLNETPEAYYWVGFLLADGNFHNKRLTVGLSIKDIEHLKSFGEYISCNNIRVFSKKTGDVCYLAAQHASVVDTLKEKFKIVNRKTINPCKINHIIDDNLFISLIVGFIDGDGSIRQRPGRNDYQIRIHVHSSWLENLQYINDRINELSGVNTTIAYIDKRGYAYSGFTNTIAIKYLKQKVLELNLPVLRRKWDIIDLNFVSKPELALYRKTEVELLYNKGISYKEIMRIVGLKEGSLTAIVNNLKKECKIQLRQPKTK